MSVLLYIRLLQKCFCKVKGAKKSISNDVPCLLYDNCTEHNRIHLQRSSSIRQGAPVGAQGRYIPTVAPCLVEELLCSITTQQGRYSPTCAPCLVEELLCSINTHNRVGIPILVLLVLYKGSSAVLPHTTG